MLVIVESNMQQFLLQLLTLLCHIGCPVPTKMCDEEISDKFSIRTVTVNDFSKICRICLIDLNSDNLDHMSIDHVRDLLDYSVEMKIECPDRLPQNFCVACIKELQRSCEFKRLIYNNDVILKKSLRDADELSLTDNKDDIVIDLHYMVDDDDKSKLKKPIAFDFTGNASENNVVSENEDSHENVGLWQNVTQHEETHANIEDIDENVKKGDSEKSEEFTYNIWTSNFQTATTSNIHIKSHAQQPPAVNERHVDAFTGEDRDHICQICSKSYKSDVLLKDHQAIHTAATKPYECNDCGKRFSLEEKLEAHIRAHMKEKPHECKDCGKRFSAKNALNIHIRTHTKERTFSCTVCKKFFSQSSSLARHMTTHSEERPYKCKICPKAYKVANELTNHTKIHTGEQPYECSDCGKRFSREDRLKLHFLTHTGEKPFNCTVCEKSFRQSSTLARHLITHSEERPYMCKICPKAFKCSIYLTMHTKTHTNTYTAKKRYVHTGEKPYECNDCGKTFSTKPSLKRHLRTHKDEKPFSCTICKKSFTHASSRDRHSMRIHSDERPHKCQICPKTFKTIHEVNIHSKIHTGEKPYACNECGKRFLFKPSLKIHLRTHIGEKPYSCMICEKSFSQNSSLSRHMSVHSGETL